MEPKRETVNGQHWTTVRELWMRKDKEQCESWKDEVQNVLIFSGLFSAIVTAFIIVSLQNLRTDPFEESVQLLKQIAAQSAGKEWVATVNPGIAPISICVNVFWFLSLVLSLTTALVGIVSLQWIRSHMRSLGAKGADSLGLSYMHSLGLRQSYIPLVFASLPVILIFGLVFFLIGLIAFLFDLDWPVAIPVTVVIVCTFAFLILTTALPALQSSPKDWPSDNPECFPSPYRSQQSGLFLHPRDWESRSEIWLQQRTHDFFHGKDVLSHLEHKTTRTDPSPFAYDTIKALVSVKESRSAESKNERMALAKCLAEVLPIHLDLFPIGDLADLTPFLPPSKFVPSAMFLKGNSARAELSAVALLQAATANGRPLQNTALVHACFITTRWLFEQPRTFDSVPESQPLDLISKPSELSHDALEVLINTLSHFFTFAANYQPKSQFINKTTHTSSYTFGFLNHSARILTQCSLSEVMQNKHTYILDIIASHLDDGEQRDYLFLTTSIYASIISISPATRPSEDSHFSRALDRYGDQLGNNSILQQLRKALRVDSEVAVD